MKRISKISKKLYNKVTEGIGFILWQLSELWTYILWMHHGLIALNENESENKVKEKVIKVLKTILFIPFIFCFFIFMAIDFSIEKRRKKNEKRGIFKNYHGKNETNSNGK